MIQVADGQWSDGERLYFYNPLGMNKLPMVAGFIPLGTTEALETTCFDVSKSHSVAWFNCYLNRGTVLRMAKSALMDELRDLEDEKAKMQAKLDALE